MSHFLSSSLSLGLDDHLQKNSYRAFFIRSKRSRDSEKEYFLARDCLSFVRTPVTKSINGISFNAYRKIVRIAKKMRIWNFFFFSNHIPSLWVRVPATYEHISSGIMKKDHSQNFDSNFHSSIFLKCTNPVINSVNIFYLRARNFSSEHRKEA